MRIVNSFLPGWHSPLLVAPDMYGPLLGVLLLPQTLLLLMETAANGCNSTTMLGRRTHALFGLKSRMLLCA